MEAAAAPGPSGSAEPQPKTSAPINVLVLGMAGSGKTSLVSSLAAAPQKPYLVNLDPACFNLPYTANIDIRDTVNFKEVMKQHSLGPNGAIVTSLNMFATVFDKVLNCIGKAPQKLCVIDTPGQIEVFTWSASGTIITESLASTGPTVVLYVMDTVRCASPVTFMSNMLYACSILYKTRLPFIVVMNKVDIVSHETILGWMRDFTVFERALEDDVADESYVTNLARSMALTLDKFYEDLKVCGVSAITGMGMDDLYRLIDEAKVIFDTDFKSEWEQLKAEKLKRNNSTKLETEGKTPSGIYLRHPGNNESSSDDSEGEEAPFEEMTGDSDKEDETFRKVVQQQREMQVKRAKEAEAKKSGATT